MATIGREVTIHQRNSGRAAATRTRPPKPTTRRYTYVTSLVFDDNSHNRDDDIDPAIRADLAAFDAAPDPLRADLSAFDRADPRSVTPRWVVCLPHRVRRTGHDPRWQTLLQTPVHRDRTARVCGPGVVQNRDAARRRCPGPRANAALAPLGLTSAEALRRPFPAGQDGLRQGVGDDSA
jgi:hypothetical protein